ncbi:MAG: DNA cytosine methyltransferase, partial [Rhodomicrobium sp.]
PLNLEKVEAAKKFKRKVVGTVYRRTRPDGMGGKVQRAEVRFDDVAGCLRTPAGGSSRQTIMVVQADVVRSRLLSPREAARLMGLPDEYPLPARYNDAYHLAGDGLVAPVVRHLAAHIIEPVLKTFAPNDWRKQASRGRDRN